MKRKKFLTVCEGGNVRSVSLAFLLKNNGQDAVAASWRWNSPETLALLCEWADYVYVMQDEFKEKIPERFRDKVGIADVGPDRFGNPLHPELIQILSPWVAQWEARDWELHESKPASRKGGL